MRTKLVYRRVFKYNPRSALTAIQCRGPRGRRAQYAIVKRLMLKAGVRSMYLIHSHIPQYY